jgi:hypothetical protein
MYKFIKLQEANDKKHKYRAIFMDLKTNREKRVSFGAKGYNDYLIYNKITTKEEADKHRERYIKRHDKREDFENPITAGSLSRYILWNKTTIGDSLRDYLKRFKNIIDSKEATYLLSLVD